MSALVTVDPGSKTDMKKIVGWVILAAIAAVAGYYFFIYVLPFLLTTVWTAIKLVIAIAILGVLLLIFSNKSFWRGIKYFCDALGQKTLGWAIEMNPFNILEYRLECAEDDALALKKCNEKLQGKRMEIKGKIEDADTELKNSLAAISVAEKVITNPNSNELAIQQAQDALEEHGHNAQSNKEYIDGLQPLFNDLGKLVTFTDKAYRNANLAIKIAKKDLSKKRDMFETVTTASNAIAAGWKALKGDADINSDAEKAIEFLKKDIGEKIGQIKSGLKITNEYMNSKDMENAAKLQSTLNKMSEIDLSTTNYSETVNKSQMEMEGTPVSSHNQYMNYITPSKKQE